jgi:Bifunctional DNA primase/polymerase, N-terminal/Family of unknown function (DUF5906)/Primase C terminal 2 (PriCT-2)
MKKSKARDLKLLTGEGMAVFPLARNTRIPLAKSHGFKDATTDYREAHEMFEDHPTANIGVATGPASGVVVLDVDVKKGKPGDASLAKIEKRIGKLTNTTVVRTTTGGRHLWFEYPGKDIGSDQGQLASGLDIRGDGGYVVAPHSIIDGKKYEWVNGLLRLKTMPDDLHELILKAQGGKRAQADDDESAAEQDADKKAADPALCRQALRAIKQKIMDWDNYNHCIKVGRAIKGAELTREDWHEWAAQSGKYTEEWADEKWDSFKPPHTSGAGSIFMWAEKSGWVRPKAKPETVEAMVQELNKRLGFIMLQGKAAIVVVDPDPQYPGTNQINFSRPQDVTQEYANDTIGIKVETANGDEKTQYENKFKVWMKSEGRRKIRQMILQPDLPPGFDPKTTDFNMWQGFGVEPQKPDKEHSWVLLQDHIEDNVASGNESYADYIYGWMAYCVQHPELKPEAALVLQGGEGAGKGTVLKSMLRLFGRHGLHLHRQKQLTGDFNAHLKDKLFIFADEAYFAGDKSARGSMNALITEDEYFIEPKFVDGFSLPNLRKIAIASNEPWVIAANMDARRYAIFEVDEKRKQDLEYFKPISDELANGGYEAMLYDLRHYDITKFDPRAIPQTAALLEQKKLNWDETTQWYFDRLVAAKDDTDWIGEIAHVHLFEIISNRTKSPWDQKQLRIKIGIALKKLCPKMTEPQRRGVEATDKDGNKIKIRDRIYTFPKKLSVARAAFAKAHRMTSDQFDWKTGNFKVTVP